MRSANDDQVGGAHYRRASYQSWDFIQDALGGRYLEGNAAKYLTRWRLKHGVEDLNKARHYLLKLRELAENGHVAPLGRRPRLMLSTQSFRPVGSLVETYALANQLTPGETSLLHLLATWETPKDLALALIVLDRIIAEAP